MGEKEVERFLKERRDPKLREEFAGKWFVVFPLKAASQRSASVTPESETGQEEPAVEEERPDGAKGGEKRKEGDK